MQIMLYIITMTKKGITQINALNLPKTSVGLGDFFIID